MKYSSVMSKGEGGAEKEVDPFCGGGPLFQSFSSGSCGNCYLIISGGNGLLIDAGVSLKRIKYTLKSEGLSTDCFGAILLTHDHMDHIRNIGSLCKRMGKVVLSCPEVHDALAFHTVAIPYIIPCRKDMKVGEWTDICSFKVLSFDVPHDATRTVGYVIDDPRTSHRFVIATDLGRVTDELLSYASTANTLVLESNYDMDMLMGGSYPHELKMRICQGNGHLSNDECAAALVKVYHKGLKNIFLCHLSENNNTPQKAYKTSRDALASIGVSESDVALRTLQRRSPSPLFNL